MLIYFRKDIAALVTAWTTSRFMPERHNDPDTRTGRFVIAGTPPIGMLRVTFQHTIKTSLRYPRVIGTTLIMFGAIPAAADRSRAVRYTKLPDGVLH